MWRQGNDKQFRDTCGKCGARRVDRQIGLEPTPEAHIAALLEVFKEVKRVLRHDGTLFLNYGDCYAGAPNGRKAADIQNDDRTFRDKPFSTARCSPKCYNLREDLSPEEKRHVCVEMFGLRIGEPQEAGQGAVPKLLSGGVENAPICPQSAMEGGGVEASVCPPQGGGDCQNNGSESQVEVGSDCRSGRSVRLLRGEGTGVHDSGSHQWGWSRSQEAPNREFAGQFGNDLPGYQAQGISDERVQGSVHELQLLHRCLGILSASKIERRFIPDSLIGFFRPLAGLKAKNLVMMPHRLAIALQEDGWYVRSAITWAKTGPMPESVTDRPASGTEMLFLLTRSERYFYDNEAVRPLAKKLNLGRNGNLLNWWLLNTQPTPEAHFATFPEALVEPCIMAGTSEWGCCPECGAPWARDTVRKAMVINRSERTHAKGRTRSSGTMVSPPMSRTTGWRPTCSHPYTDIELVPAVVLDPFGGSGTVARVASRLGRRSILCELNPEYIDIAHKRTAQRGLEL